MTAKTTVAPDRMTLEDARLTQDSFDNEVINLLRFGGQQTDPILLWNEVALEANRISHTNGKGEQAGPPLSARALAIVHLAMYDAYAGVTNDPANLPPYLPGLPSPGAGAAPASGRCGGSRDFVESISESGTFL